MTPVYPSPDLVLLFSTYLILIGSILAFAIYEFNSGVAFQVITLIMIGLAFAFLIYHHIIHLPASFISFLTDFSIPVVTNLVLVLIYAGMGLKLGADAKSLRGSGLRVALAGIMMAVMDIVPPAIIMGFACEPLLHWPWAYGALLGTLLGETSAAVVVPYLNHLMDLVKDRGEDAEHMKKISSVLKLESTVNSVVLLLFVALFYNLIFLKDPSPTFNSFFSLTYQSLSGVLVYHSAVLVFVLVGIPALVYLGSRLIVFGVRRKIVDRKKSRLKAYAFFSMNDIVVTKQQGDVSEKQLRMGMILYGIVLGIAMLVYESILYLTSFAGFTNVLFTLIGLIYLGFFIGFLFPGGEKTVVDKDTDDTGERTFTGMMLFHDEFELLIRIVFYFSIGIQLGIMLFSPPLGVHPIPSGEITGVIVLILIMAPLFLLFRLMSGGVGLPIAFYTRYSVEKSSGDMGLVAATMPKGITVAAISVLILQSGMEYGGTIYVLALVSIIVSTLGFTFITSLGMRSVENRKKRKEKIERAAVREL
ncbi:MAG: hypothetical protein KIY11_07505 [Thermoplasmata archaeon]|nr:hypothetical protein [Candidatus Sysuiplasma acidicola]